MTNGDEPDRSDIGKRMTGSGLIIINTGHGKGKSTAAFGLMMRARGRGMKVGGVQFIKGETSRFGEHIALADLGVELIPAGRGFTWTSHDLDVDAARAQAGWQTACRMIDSGEYGMLLLDEITYPIRYGWLDVTEVIEALARRPDGMHVILTGRDAPAELIDFADLVTEMREIKHPFRDRGLKAQKGIEF